MSKNTLPKVKEILSSDSMRLLRLMVFNRYDFIYRCYDKNDAARIKELGELADFCYEVGIDFRAEVVQPFNRPKTLAKSDAIKGEL